jgi:hypothetical protein
MGVSFQYGKWNDWLHCRIAIGDVRVAHTVNGCHHGDLELLDAAAAIFGRAKSAQARFEEEPGEFRWKIDRLEVNRIRIRIFGFDDWDSNLPDDSGRLLFDATCGVVSFAQAIHDGFCAWVDEMRIAGREIRVEALQERIDALRGHLSRVRSHR